MKLTSLLLFFLPFSSFCISGPVVAKDSLDTIAVLNLLIGERFPDSHVLSMDKGDLNLDGREDFVVVASRNCDENEASLDFHGDGVQCRRVFLVVSNAAGMYVVGGSNDHIIECSQCGGAGVGDPNRGVRIENGSITFESFYGACDKTTITVVYTYDKAKNNWYQSEHIREDYSCQEQNNPDGEIRVTTVRETPADFGVVAFDAGN